MISDEGGEEGGKIGQKGEKKEREVYIYIYIIKLKRERGNEKNEVRKQTAPRRRYSDVDQN